MTVDNICPQKNPGLSVWLSCSVWKCCLHLFGFLLSAANAFNQSKHSPCLLYRRHHSVTIVSVRPSITHASTCFLVLAFGRLLFVSFWPSVSVFFPCWYIFPLFSKKRNQAEKDLHFNFVLCMWQDGGANLDPRSAEELWGTLQGSAGGVPDHSRPHCPAGDNRGPQCGQAALGLQWKTDSQCRQETEAGQTAGLKGLELKNDLEYLNLK